MAGEGDGPGERVELGEVYEQELVALPVAGDLSFGDPAAEGDAVAAGVGGGLGEGGGAAWPARLRVDAPWWGTGMGMPPGIDRQGGDHLGGTQPTPAHRARLSRTPWRFASSSGRAIW
jgi:hypothetical protein